MFDTLVKQMKNAESITEQLKDENQLKLICHIQNVKYYLYPNINMRKPLRDLIVSERFLYD